MAEAFLEAISPVELDLYEKAMVARQEMADAAEHARQQQLERLSYQAELARRRFERADPDNRLVAAELERDGRMPARAEAGRGGRRTGAPGSAKTDPPPRS